MTRATAEQRRIWNLNCRAKKAERARLAAKAPTAPVTESTLFCDRCGRQLVETIEPTDRHAGEPPMNLHTYRCAKPGCVPGTGRKILHGDRPHTCNPHPDPAVRICVRLPRVMARSESILDGKVGYWDDPLPELPEAGLRGDTCARTWNARHSKARRRR